MRPLFGPALLMAVLIGTTAVKSAEVDFLDFFTDKTMRIDYFHIGDAETEWVTLDQVYGYGQWGGSKTHLIDPFNQGAYLFKIYDVASEQLIFSRGFDSYFKEYQSSGPASEGKKRTFHESALIPFPKQSIRFALEKRDKRNKLAEVFSATIDPSDVGILLREPNDPEIIVVQSQKGGHPHTSLDIALIAEGYQATERPKFEKDLARFTELLFRSEPYKSHRNRFNVYGVMKPSIDSGIDEPRAGVYRNTPVSATFNSMGSERYVLTEDNKALRDIASHVPYDALYIMVNHSRYGGGGIYNLYCTFTTDSQWSEYLFVHEFGHSLLGLADEYYTSAVAYEDFYPSGMEPLEPNITALQNPKNVKWKRFLTPESVVPTPWEKANYDTADLKWQKIRRELNTRIANLRRAGGHEQEVTNLQKRHDKMDRENAERIQEYLQASAYAGQVGAFEGAGYATTGLYRPMLDCIMFSKGSKKFCIVCESAIQRIIDHYAH